MVSAINPNDYSQPILDSWSEMDLPTEVSRKVPDEYSKDTIEQAKIADDTWSLIAGMYLQQQLQVSHDSKAPRPKLPSPSFNSNNLNISEVKAEVGKLLAQVEDAENAENNKQEKPLDKNLQEIALLQSFIQFMKIQRQHSKADAELTLHSIEKRLEANKNIKTEYFNKLDEHIADNKKSEILKWINWILYGALALVGLGSLALTITASVVTGGLAISLGISITIALVNGVLSIGSGATSLLKGWLDYNNKKLLGVLEEKKWERIMNNSKVDQAKEEMRQSMEVVADNWKELIDVINNWFQASIIKD